MRKLVPFVYLLCKQNIILFIPQFYLVVTYSKIVRAIFDLSFNQAFLLRFLIERASLNYYAIYNMSKISRVPFSEEPTQLHVNTLNQTENSASIYQTYDLQTQSQQSDIKNRKKSQSSISFANTVSRLNKYRTKIDIPRDLNLQQLKQIINQISIQGNLSIQVLSQKKFILTKSYGNIFRELFNCCFRKVRVQTLIVIEFVTDGLNRKRYLNMRLVQGNKQQFQEFILLMETHLKQTDKDTSIDSTLMGLNQFLTSQNFITPTFKPTLIMHQINCYEELQKVMKQSYSDSIKQFMEQIRSISIEVEKQKSQTSKLVECVINSTNKIFKLVEQQLPQIKTQLLYYSLEKYLSQYSNTIIADAYSQKFKQEDEVFHKKREKLYSKNPQSCMKYLDIKPKYRLISEEDIPYSSAIQLLSQLNSCISLRGFLFTIQSYYSQIKVNCYEHHRGKQQISTMDDILPVMIYTVLKSTVYSFYGIQQMVSDYVRISGRFEIDMRILTNLFVALQYISKEWVID